MLFRSTCAYHDLDLLEDRCKTNESVCYICDGADSLGGYAPVAELSYLQQKYGLHVYYDEDRKSTRLNSSHSSISYAVFCLKKKCEIASRKPFERAFDYEGTEPVRISFLSLV